MVVVKKDVLTENEPTTFSISCKNSYFDITNQDFVMTLQKDASNIFVIQMSLPVVAPVVKPCKISVPLFKILSSGTVGEGVPDDF